MKGVTMKVEEVKKENDKYLDPKTNKIDYDTLKTTFPSNIDPTRK